ncbi:phage tail length tape measure family protein [Sphingomonas lacusdianchii]|uniref:phage tail length tape measure family protein n=1 Tax=Sphingomonas lacusdianchii TaxID=2917992 RepID=UPI001F56B699|nr:phage tail length tape measure family protein [Sphingomonas sp. JXJ CY 53]
MDDASPALGVGFEIDAAAAFGTIDRLEDGMDAATNSIVADAKRVEQATGGMVNLGGATAEVNTFGNATTKAMRETVRETARAEKAGEGMVRALGRQATEFGKTRSEIRTMNAELRAVEAESRGLTELAGRIRAVSAEMNRLEASSVNVGQSTNKAGAGLRIIAMQMPDVIQGLLTGQKPMQVLIQQGGQVYQAGQSAGIGLRAMGASLAALLIPFAPVIAAIGVATAGFALFNREINRGVSNEELTRGLGKTAEQAEVAEKQLKKLREETITWGDTASALFTVVGNDIKNSFVKDMTDMGSDVKSVLDDLTSYGRSALAGLYAGTVGMKAYLGEVSKPGAIAKLLTGDDPTLFNRTVGASFNKAYDWLGKLGERVRAEAKKNARIRIGEEYGLPDKPKKDSHADQLAREAEAMERQIDNLYKLANAYGVSGAAALIAEARVKAESAAIKKRADVEAAVDRQIRLSIAERVKAGAQSAAAMRDEAMVQASVNSAVRDGSVAARDAQQVMRDRMADLPLLAAMEAAHTLKGKEGVRAVEEAEKALNAQRKAQSDLNAERTRGQLIQMNQSNDRQLAVLREELRLVGATDVVRARSLARVRAEQEVGSTPGADAAKYIEDMVSIADAQAQIQLQTQATNDALAHQGVMFDTIAINAADAARGMSDAFGEAGRALGDMGAIFAGHIADQQRLTAARDAELKALVGLDDQKLKAQRTAQINDLFALRSSAAQIGMYGDMTAAAKGFFDEKSKGYAVLSIAEKAFRAVEFAMSVKAMAQDAIETGSKIASTVARTAVRATEAVVNAIASLPFPANIAAGAATAGALAALGVSVVSSFGGSSRDKLQKANDGSGSVLGDTKAQSESIKRSIDQLREVDTVTNAFAGEMAASLRSIDNQIGGVASAIVRGGDINASAGVNESFKTNAIGSILKATIPIFGGALASLFGSTTSVIASGLSAQSQTLGSILSGGFDAQTFSDVEKKKKFLGIVTGKSYSTQYGNADPALEGQFTLLLKSFSSAIGAAAGPLGEATDAVQARLNGFVVSIGKIDLKGLTGEQIQEKLSAVFGKAADDMADAAFPGIARFQQVGEGAFETLVRVASTVEAVTASLDQLGLASRALGIDAKVGIAAQFDSVSAMTSAADAYFKAFYTPAEQNAARMSQLNGVFVRLGTTMPATIDAFRALVDAQDLTTAAGQSTYATLLQIAPAFADLKSALDGAKSAADVIAEREGLQRRLLELDGNTAAIRALDLAKLDASNRALQEQIYAIEDAKAAAEAANELRQAWSSVGDTIADEVKRIRGLDTVGGGASFAAIMGQFNAANLSARGGDIDAAKTLPGLSQALLKVAGEQATSSQELKRIQAQTAATLEATQAAIAGRSAAAATAAILANSANAAAATAPAGTAANDASAATIADLRDELAALRRENAAGHAATASNTGKMARVLDDVTAASGGDAFSVVNGG